MARRSAPCPVCGRLLAVEVAANNLCVIPAHGHKKSPCTGGEKVAQYRDQPTLAQAVTQARELIAQERASRLAAPGHLARIDLAYEENLEKKAMDAAFARP